MKEEQNGRPSPIGKPVSLFVTCMVDMLFPETGISVVDVLEHLGVTVIFPKGQTCCGQPGFNAGYWQEARVVALHFLKTFAQAEVIVTPSGSCATMVRHEFPRLFEDDPILLLEAKRQAAITWEFSEYIVAGLGVQDINGRLPIPQTFAFHDACHGLRQLELGREARTLVGNLENATVTEMDEHDVCCGFGGLFSIKMAEPSGAMLGKKIMAVLNSDAQILTGDVSCMTHINGGLAKKGTHQRLHHFADILAEGVRKS
jgi:L-lactate dehydrogenase complex protein LldE